MSNDEREAVARIASLIRQQIEASRHYLLKDGTDPNFADILLSHYADFAGELERLSALPTLRSPQDAEPVGLETFWVLEGPDLRRASDPIRYWRPQATHDPAAYWTESIHDALQFSRRRDAEAYHQEKRFSDRIKVVEHAWITAALPRSTEGTTK